MRILYLVNDAAFFLTHRLPLAQAALASGYEVHVATPKDDAASAISSYGFKFHEVPIGRRSTNLFAEIGSFFCIYKLYRRVRPDIVHNVTIKPIIYGGLAARLAKVPAVVNAFAGLGYIFVSSSLKARALRVLAKVSLRLIKGHPNTTVIFQNPDDQKLCLRGGLVSASNTVLIRGSGVDMVQFSPAPEPQGVPLTVFASRLLWNKGVGVFVEASASLRDYVRARFALVGDTDPGNPDAVPMAQIDAWKQEGSIELWGWCDNMVEVCRQTHIMCLPSYYGEGVPKVLIEAAACGRPIVTTDTPGCREIVRHEVNGLLVPPRDAKALADALRRLIENPDLRRRMGQAGREIAIAEFSLEKVVSETLEVYRKLLACRTS